MEDNQLRQWINDLQSKMYVNCVYCGHRYGPQSTPTSMADVLKRHVEQCPNHPMSVLKKENEELKWKLAELTKAIRKVTGIFDRTDYARTDYAASCEHANKNPYVCSCESRCYCKTRTCKGK